jgi:phosphate-selective porin OprO and OprP
LSCTRPRLAALRDNSVTQSIFKQPKELLHGPPVPDAHHPKTMHSMKTIHRVILASSLLGCIPAHAGTEAPIDTAPAEVPYSTATGLLVWQFPGETAWDRAWSGFTLYKDDNNQVLQEFALKGRLQVQSIYGETNYDSFNTSDFKDAGNDEAVWGNDIEARRARFGFKSKWFQNWKFEGLINVDTDFKDADGSTSIYKDLYELYLGYAPSDAFNVTAGKTKVRFSREQEISSNEILTFERSLMSNTFFPGELTGAWVNGKGIKEYWQYELGIYGSDRVREFSGFDQGVVVLGKIGYDYSAQAGLDTAVASIHYMHNSDPGFADRRTRDYTPGTSPSFTDSIALTNDITSGRFGLTTELLYGFGFDGFAKQNGANVRIDQSNVIAMTVIPSYYIADGLQLVGRVQLASCEDPNDLRVPARYERLAKKTRTINDDEFGNTYVSAYLGLNYYIYGHKLKIMNGIEYSKMGGGDYDGFTAMTGLRFNF